MSYLRITRVASHPDDTWIAVTLETDTELRTCQYERYCGDWQLIEDYGHEPVMVEPFRSLWSSYEGDLVLSLLHSARGITSVTWEI